MRLKPQQPHGAWVITRVSLKNLTLLDEPTLSSSNPERQYDSGVVHARCHRTRARSPRAAQSRLTAPSARAHALAANDRDPYASGHARLDRA
jgi:hypothetical protein